MRQLTRRDIIFVIVGLLSLAFYVFSYSQVYWEAALRNTISRGEALRKAKSLIENWSIADSIRMIDPDIRFHADQDLIQFFQERKGLTDANGQIASEMALGWRLSWKPASETNVTIGRSKSSDKASDGVPLVVRVDNLGRLTLFEYAPRPGSSTDAEQSSASLVPVNIDSARAQATAFIAGNIKSNDRLVEKAVRPILDGKSSGFEFVFSEPPTAESLTWKTKITVLNDHVRRFERLYEFPTNFTLPGNRTFNEFKSSKTLIAMILLIIMVLIFFLRQLSKGLLDRKMAIFGGLIGLITFGIQMAAISVDGPWWTALIVIFFGGGFWALICAVVVSTGTGMAHQTWTEKVKSFEGLRLGKLLNQKIAAGILRGVTFGMIALGVSSLIIRWWPDAVFDSASDSTERLSQFGTVGLVMGSIGFSLFHVVTVYLIILSSLAHRRSRTLLIVFGTVLGVVSGYLFNNLEPWSLQIVVLAGFGLLMTYLIVRYDVVTAWMALLFMQTLQGGYAFFLHGDVVHASVMGTWFILLGGVITMGLTSKDTGEHLEEYQPEYLRQLHNKERMEREFEIARHIQTTMLCCKIPQNPFVDIASICHPAHEVGGDYYDFMKFGSNGSKFGVVIGDVSGKGVSAAFYMTLVKGILQTQSYITPDSTRDTLIRVNEIFYEHAEKTKFISMLYAVFDLDRGIIRMSRAGHNPLLVRKSHQNDIQTVSPPGIAIGLSKGDVFAGSIEETELTLQSGDVFVFYTDGFSEAMNKHGVEFGETRMMETIQRTSGQASQQMIDTIRKEITSFAGSAPQHDDMTMIVVKIR